MSAIGVQNRIASMTRERGVRGAVGHVGDQASERTIVSLPLPDATTMNPSER